MWTSCVILQHGYRDGSLEEVDLRHLGNEDGQTVIAKHIRCLACFFFFFMYALWVGDWTIICVIF